jgi:hypothetical protein
MSPSVPLLNLPCAPGRYVYPGWGTLFQSTRRCYPGDQHYSFAVKLCPLSSEVIWKCDLTGASEPAHALYAVRIHFCCCNIASLFILKNNYCQSYVAI